MLGHNSWSSCIGRNWAGNCALWAASRPCKGIRALRVVTDAQTAFGCWFQGVDQTIAVRAGDDSASFCPGRRAHTCAGI